jgi:predicted TIM-barrel fold metal-dependent hydrolase
LREAVELVGEQKLLWGTDVPITLRRYTYRQMADFIALHCDFLDVNSRNRILGDNAAAIFFCGQ